MEVCDLGHRSGFRRTSPETSSCNGALIKLPLQVKMWISALWERFKPPDCRLDRLLFLSGCHRVVMSASKEQCCPCLWDLSQLSTPLSSLAPTVPRSANLVCTTYMDFDSCVSPAPCCRALLRFSASPRGTMHLLFCLSVIPRCGSLHPFVWSMSHFPFYRLYSHRQRAGRLVNSTNANHVYHPVSLRKSDITIKRSIKSSKNINVSKVVSQFADNLLLSDLF